MKINLIRFYLILFSSTWLVFSCETLVADVDPKLLPQIEEKLVVNSFISPQDTLVRVVVTSSSPIFTESKSVFRSFTVINGDTTYFAQEAFVSDAKVEMSNGEKTIELAYSPIEKWYSFRTGPNTFRIEANKTYELKVSRQNKTVEATTTVPSQAVNSIQLISKITEGETLFANSQKQATLSFQMNATVDFDNSENKYYRLRGDFEAEIQTLNFPENSEPFYSTVNAYFRIRFNDRGLINGTLLNSKTLSSSNNVSNESAFLGNSIITSDLTPQIKAVLVEGMTINEPYYLYYKSLDDYRDNNPFVEPTPIYTNINGGLGVFAASNKKSERVYFQNNKQFF